MLHRENVVTSLIVVAVCLMVLSVGTLAANRDVWYQEDFEEYQVGNFVTPLTKQNNGWRQYPVEVANTLIVSDHAHTGSQSLKLKSHYISSYDFPKRSGEHWIRAYINIETLTDRWFSVSLHNHTPSATAYMWFYADGSIEANKGDGSGQRNMVPIGLWKPNEWYEITFRVKSEARQYDVCVKDSDGNVVGEAFDFGFQHANASDVEELQFMAPTDFASSVYIDDIVFSSSALD